MKNNGYMDRAMRSRDPRYARILGKLGYDRRDMVAVSAPVLPPLGDIAVLRAEYEAKIGKRPFMGWDADTIRAKLAEAAQK